jgi:hypothetical protein
MRRASRSWGLSFPSCKARTLTGIQGKLLHERRCAGSRRAANRFERHAKLTLLLLAVASFGGLELASHFIVRRPGFYKEYNRRVSGYTVFENTPRHRMETRKSSPDQPDVVVDDYGFVSAEPVSVVKPEGTVRLFVMGGSAAFGAEQNSSYRDVYPYPTGVYSFDQSIAGQLRAYLERRQPGTRFEVITAAAYTRAYHQSFLFYLETVDRFSPDWIIDLDGFNDIHHLVSGTPYEDRASELQYYIDLQDTARCVGTWKPGTWCLLEGLINRARVSAIRGARRAAPGFARSFDLDRYTKARYEARKTDFVRGSLSFLRTLRHEMAVLRADGAELLFVLQPMLHREGRNKALSPREAQMARRVAPPLYAELPSSPATTAEEFADAMLVLKYFFDDYLSGALEAELAKMRFHYLDMNRAIESLPASLEFYTDYCHMTPEGNRAIAEKIGEVVLAASGHARAL